MTGGTWPPLPPHQQQCGQQDKGRVGRQEGRQGERGWFGYRVIHMRNTNVEIKERERRGSTLCSAFLPSLHPSIHHLCLPDRDWAPQVDGWNLAHVGHVEQEDLHEMLIAKSLFPLLCDAAEEWWWWRRQNQWIILKQGWWRWPRSRGWWPSLRRRRTSWWDADISVCTWLPQWLLREATVKINCVMWKFSELKNVWNTNCSFP